MSDERPDTTSSSDHGRTLQPGHMVERYVVDSLLGTGGTATVYKVHHAELGTVYALKVLSIVSPGIRRRTLQEGRVQARLNHRNIVAVFDTFEIDGAPGLLLEYVEGPSLDQALGRFRFSFEQAEILFRGVIDGMRQAHRLGLVHRDLKPANVLLAQTPLGVIPKVTDFGIAKLVSSEDIGHTRQGVAMGTPQYMAPEQIRDAKNVDQRADMFSLGCMLYELITHRRAFPDDDIVRVFNAVCDGEYVPAREIVPDLPDRIDQAIRGCMEVDRDRRIPDCDTLIEVFEGRRPWTGERISTPTAVPPSIPPLDASSTYLPADLLTRLDEDTTEVRSTVPVVEHVQHTTLAESLPPPPPRREGLTAMAVVLAVIGALVIGLWAGRTSSPPVVLPVAEPTPVVAPTPELATPELAASPPVAEPVPAAANPALQGGVAAADPPPSEPTKAPTGRPEPTNPRSRPTEKPPAPPREVSVTKEPEPVATPSPPAKGSMQTTRILSVPPTATMWIDGKSRGLTPQKFELEVGHHQVRLKSGEEVVNFVIEVKGSTDNRWCYLFEAHKAVAGSCPR